MRISVSTKLFALALTALAACGPGDDPNTAILPGTVADCTGKVGGLAYLDDCGQCVGGSTGKPACEIDCSGKPNGKAVYDACDLCTGGDTGQQACVADCSGTPGGTAFVDGCKECVGGNTGKKACTKDCTGAFGGAAQVDQCGLCSGGTTGKAACTQDCNKEFGGLAFIDECGQCVGGTTHKTACHQDCEKHYGGTASVDNCGQCVGGDTGKDACVQDCNGDWGGVAFVDACNKCVGGHTGLTACVQDCTGTPGGSAFMDLCGQCVSGNTGKTACQNDCSGTPGGSAQIDSCGKCSGGTTGRPACTQDCHGDWGGSARVDDCNTCVEGLTGKTACAKDCHGDWGGSAIVDHCNTCSGGNTGKSACEKDCNGQWGGLAAIDHCDVCAGGTTGKNPCVQDCNGDWGGSAVVDGCNRCTGGNTGLTACLKDCHGDPGGSAHYDECHTCVDGHTGLSACTQDCAGIWGGSAKLDQCSQCVGGTTARTACSKDCNGDWGGSATVDHCGVCSGGNSQHDACTQDCHGDWGGSAELDHCGVCSGGNSKHDACTQDCHDDWGGSAKVDQCGMCTGGSTGQVACVADCNGDLGGSAHNDECGKCVEGKTGRTACIPGQCTVGSADYPTIQLAINDVKCQVILVNAGTFHERLEIARSLVIRGAAADLTVVTGDGLGRVVNIHPPSIQPITVQLESLSVTGGLSDYGAGIYAKQSNTTLLNVNVHHNLMSDASTASGAGIDSDDGVLTLDHATVQANRCAKCDGAGIAVIRGSVSITDSTIADNTINEADSAAGAGIFVVANADDFARFKDSRVTGNHGTSVTQYGYAYGAGIYVIDAQTSIDGCTISGNAADSRSGGFGVALALNTNSITVRDTVIDHNTFSASSGGSILYMNGGVATNPRSDVTLEHVIVESNRLEATNLIWAFSNSIFDFNLFNEQLNLRAQDLTIRNNQMVANGAASSSGGIWEFYANSYDDPTPTVLSAFISQCVIQGNVFTGGSVDGALVDARTDFEAGAFVNVVLDRSLIAGNTLNMHGTLASNLLAANLYSSVLLQNSTVHNNVIEGGGTLSDSSNASASLADGFITFHGATVTDNTSSFIGHAQPLYSAVKAYHSVFSGNTSSTGYTCTPATAVALTGHHNLINESQHCISTSDAQSLVDVDPKLGTLADNGGPTLTRAPLADSPLIDAGDLTCSGESDVAVLSLDQRSAARPLGNACDIGSVELR